MAWEPMVCIVGAMLGHVAFVQLHGGAVEGMVVGGRGLGTVELVQVSGTGEGTCKSLDFNLIGLNLFIPYHILLLPL